MKKLVALTVLASAMAVAGPLKVVAAGAKEGTYPVRHSKKTAHGMGKAVKGTTKAAGKTLKFVLW